MNTASVHGTLDLRALQLTWEELHQVADFVERRLSAAGEFTLSVDMSKATFEVRVTATGLDLVDAFRKARAAILSAFMSAVSDQASATAAVEEPAWEVSEKRTLQLTG